MKTVNDIDLAYGITFDANDVQCGREKPLFGEQMGNLTVRHIGVTYTIRRYGDPMTHAAGVWSSRTACRWLVVGRDDVSVAKDRFLTCVRCIAILFWLAEEKP